MEKLILVKNKQGLADLRAYLEDKEFVAFDTETTGVDRESEIIGFSVAAEDNIGYYVIMSYWNPTEKRLIRVEEVWEEIQGFLQYLTIKHLVMHNGVFDCSMVENNHKVSLIGSLHTDTMILAHVLDENRAVGLKELGTTLFGDDARKEQKEMHESVTANGGSLTKACYELYKADAPLIGRYGAKDAILTIKLFYVLVEELYAQGLEKFFYEDESMPLLKGPTYQMNTTGLRVDPQKLQKLKAELEAECLDLKAYVHKEIDPHVKAKYPGTGKTNHFNIGAGQQLAWLLFDKLGNEFHLLTESGRELCKYLDIKIPYAPKDKVQFIKTVKMNKDRVWKYGKVSIKTGKPTPIKVGDYWKYLSSGKETLGKFAKRYKWVDKLLEYHRSKKLLTTYVLGIEERMKYNIIRPNFLQHGTTSGRYSCRNPNFQNLPRKDKRVKACIVSRPGKVFVGADYDQLEPRVFASMSQDPRLMASFASSDDFYSVIGMEVFDKYDCTPQKEGSPQAFGVKYPELRDIAKVVALSSTYGTTAPKMAPAIGKSMQEAQEVIDTYFEHFPDVQRFMEESHELAKEQGFVTNLYGRPRRMPKAKDIDRIYGKRPHSDLPYEARNILNLAVNHRVQSTGASIMNKASIAIYKVIIERGWSEVKLVMQVHDQVVLEGPEELKDQMISVVKYAMEHAADLPGVKLSTTPFASYDLAGQK